MHKRAIVYPILTTRDIAEPAPPFLVEGTSKKAAIRALRERGYRVMWRGGLHESYITTPEDICLSHSSDARVYRKERDILRQISDLKEIKVFVITVYQTVYQNR